MNSSKHSDNLTQEAQAFDSQIEERIANGHVSDLRLTGHCAPKLLVLGVGYGLGYPSFELARSGFDHIGLDLSSKCIASSREWTESWLTRVPCPQPNFFTLVERVDYV